MLISACSGLVDPKAGEASPLTDPICGTNDQGQFQGDDTSLTCLELSFPSPWVGVAWSFLGFRCDTSELPSPSHLDER